LALDNAPEFSAILPVADGGHTLDVALNSKSIEGLEGDLVSIGALRFCQVHAFFEVEVTMELDNGDPPEVLLAGLPCNLRTPFGNPYYPHIALAQEGRNVRIVGTRAAWRLLRANPGTFLRLAPSSQRGRWQTVEFTSDERDRISAGARRLLGACHLEGAGFKSKVEPIDSPADWSLGEPAFWQ